jgi:plastocyanin
MKTRGAIAGIGALVLFAGLSGFTFAPSDGPAGCDPNAPGSCDKYDPNDPFVNGKTGPVAAKTVQMSGFAFQPTTITGSPGETWTEDNEDVATHNITTEKVASTSTGNQTGGDIAPDVMSKQKKTFKMPTKPGTYKTVCFYHQDMKLTIIVK